MRQNYLDLASNICDHLLSDPNPAQLWLKSENKDWHAGKEAVFPLALSLELLAPFRCLPHVEILGTSLLKLLRPESVSWGYYLEDSTVYPEDLDDTAVSLLALHLWNGGLTTTQLDHLISLLITLEEKPGGPYKTWIISSRDSHWQDVDPVVNLNIARLLKTLDILPRPLESFVLERLKEGLASPYYPVWTIKQFFAKKFGEVPRTNIETQASQPSSLAERALLWLADTNPSLKAGNNLIRFITSRVEFLQHTEPIAVCLDQARHGDNILAGSRFFANCIYFATTLKMFQLNCERTHSDIDSFLSEKILQQETIILESFPEVHKKELMLVLGKVLSKKQILLFGSPVLLKKIRDGNSHLCDLLISIHLYGWIFGTVLDDLVDLESSEPAKATLLLLRVWDEVQHLLESLIKLDPDLSRFIKGISLRTLLAWERDLVRNDQFREERAIGTLILWIGLTPTSDRARVFRLLGLVLEATQVSDDLKDAEEDNLSEASVRGKVRRLEQILQRVRELILPREMQIVQMLDSLCLQAKSFILLKDVIQSRAQISESNR